MSRTIKFRGKSIKTDEWVYGWYCQIDDIHIIVNPKKTSILNDSDNLRSPDWVIYDVIEVTPETVGQLTGLHDKNGKEDWIDDIVKAKVGQFIYRRRIFQAESGAYCINLPTIGVTDGQSAIMLITIEHTNIGNFWENPELLEK